MNRVKITLLRNKSNMILKKLSWIFYLNNLDKKIIRVKERVYLNFLVSTIVINAHTKNVVKSLSLKIALFRMWRFIQVKRNTNVLTAKNASLPTVTRKFMKKDIWTWKSNNAWSVECSSSETVNWKLIRPTVTDQSFRFKEIKTSFLCHQILWNDAIIL